MPTHCVITRTNMGDAWNPQVSLGYSVVRPHLGAQLPKVAFLGFSYFLLGMTYCANPAAVQPVAIQPVAVHPVAVQPVAVQPVAV